MKFEEVLGITSLGIAILLAALGHQLHDWIIWGLAWFYILIGSYFLLSEYF